MQSLPWDHAVLCEQPNRILSKGIWRGDNPFHFSGPICMLQMALATSVTGCVHYFMKPLWQCSYVSHMIGGLLLSPIGIGANDIIRRYVFSIHNAYVFETIQIVGCLLFIFLASIQLDLGLIRRAGSKAFAIGFSAFICPVIFTTFTSFLILTWSPTNKEMSQMLPIVSLCVSFTSNQVVGTLLSDLKLVNSEIGRLTIASSTVTNIISWLTGVMVLTCKEASIGNVRKSAGMFFFTGFTIAFFVFMKPLLLWLFQNKPRDEDGILKEFHILIILIMVLFSGLVGELMGQHYVLGPMILGLILPPGHPIGAMVEQKFKTFTLLVLMPIFYVASAARATAHGIGLKTFWTIEPIILIGCFGKLFGTFLSCHYYGMASRDSFLAGLIMSSQGVTELQYYRHIAGLKLVSYEAYSLMTLSSVLLTAIIAPLLKLLYRPSSRIMKYRGRTLEFSGLNTELRIVVCIYREASVPTVIDVLEVSNPTIESPICIYLLHLVELQGPGTPLFVAHERDNVISSTAHNRSSHIINAFRQYEQHNIDIATVSPYTSIAPYATMHDDICNLAIDKKATLVIIPFHRQRNLDGLMDNAHRIRNVNRNVLNTVPCSVGILVDPTSTSRSCVSKTKSFYRVVVVFLGGPDDRETLAYASRMAEHPNTSITVIRISAEEDKSAKVFEKRLDGNSINHFRLNSLNNERIVFREEVVEDSVGTVTVIRSLEGSYDLIMVGRHHRMESPVVSGLVDWNDFPELGFVGDLLATSNCREGSIMVVQQPMFISDDLPPGTPTYYQRNWPFVVSGV